jgi:hypothetical protein
MVSSFAVIVLALSFVICMPVSTFASDHTSGIGKAEDLLKKKEYEEAIVILKPMLEDDQEKEMKARIHFLMGRVLYEKAFAVISANRVAGKVKFKDIAPPQVNELKAAAEHFLQVVGMGSDEDLQPDAYFMLGKVWDYDCLQKFGKSKESYSKAADMKPGTEMSKDATQCVERLERYFTSHGQGHQ